MIITPAESKLNEVLPPIVQGVSDNILAYAILLAAIATLSMTMLELIKGMASLRYHYNRSMFVKWIKQNVRNNSSMKRREYSSTDAYNQLLVLSVTDPKLAPALFDQATDKMMGKVQATVNIVMDYPTNYPDLYFFLTSVNYHDAGDINNVEKDAELWYTYSEKINAAAPEDPGGLTNAEITAATQARGRIEHIVNRKLDAFQVRNDFVWARFNQTISILGSGAIIFILMLYIGAHPVSTLFLSIFGGMISPFAKDVVTALSGLKAKK